MDESDLIVSSTEIIKDKLYFATLAKGYKPKSTKNSKYFHIEGEIVYDSFYFDFGPYHLCHLYQFCGKLNKELADAPKSKKIVFYTSTVDTLRLNAAYLIGSFAIIYLDKSPQWIHNQLMENCSWSLLTFRDASDGPPLFNISLLDVFQGLHIAYKQGFFNFDDFDEFEYLYCEKVENGDLNWIIPQKMLAFSGPHAKSRLDRGYQLHSPEHYHKYFRDNNVTTIVRLNKERYDARQFTAHGFDHRDLFFVDGSAPTDAIVNRFINICIASPGAVAVHCKAGLGRTGTLIGCYLMRQHAFTARQAIGWLRLCRPGSVIGLQQPFLENIAWRMLAEGKEYRRSNAITALPKFKLGIYSELAQERAETENVENELLDNAAVVKDKPVSLNAILNSVGNTAINNNAVRVARKTKKLDDTNITCNPIHNSVDQLNPENNITASNVQKRSPAAPILVTTETGYIPKMNFMMPTNNIRNANNTNLKTSTRLKNPRCSRPTNMMSTFPPTRSSSISLSKLQSAKVPAKPTFQRTNPLKMYTRKIPNLSYNRVTTQNNTTIVLPNNNTASTITALTENCSIDAKNGNITSVNVSITTNRAVKTLPNNQKSMLVSDTSTRKKNIPRSVSVTRKKLPKNLENACDVNFNIDQSGSDTTNTNLSIDSLNAVPSSNEKIRRKRDKSKSPESAYCRSDEATLDNYEESNNSQGNKLYKIKAMREKCPGIGAMMLQKKDNVKARLGIQPPGSSAKKK